MSRKRLSINNIVIISILIFIIPLLLFNGFKTVEYKALDSVQDNQSNYTWQIGDNYKYLGTGPFGNSSYRVEGITTWNGKDVYNISSNLTFIQIGFIKSSNYHSIVDFDLVGGNQSIEFLWYGNLINEINYTLYSEANLFNTPASSFFEEGSLTRNQTSIQEVTYVYHPSLEQTVSNSSVYKSNQSSTMVTTEYIRSESVTNSAGTFECWKASGYESQAITANVSFITVGGDIGYRNFLFNVTRVNATHFNNNHWQDNNGSISTSNTILPATNATTYYSKLYSIRVNSTYFTYNSETGIWDYVGGDELIELNIKQPPTSTTIPLTNTTETSTSSQFTSTTTSLIPGFTYLGMIIGLILFRINRRKR